MHACVGISRCRELMAQEHKWCPSGRFFYNALAGSRRLARFKRKHSQQLEHINSSATSENLGKQIVAMNEKVEGVHKTRE